MTPVSSALVLAAGLGTRLRPLTHVRAKAAVPLAGEPLVRHVASRLAAHGVTDLVVNLHHRPETVARALGTVVAVDGSDRRLRVRYSWEGSTVLGSAGGPRLALPLLGDSFFIVNGDTLTDVDLQDLASAHLQSGALVTLALVPNLDPQRYGGVRLDTSGRVTGFAPRGPGARGALHFTGVQVANADAFAGLTSGSVASTVGGLYDRLIAERPGSVRGWVCDAGFFDIGTVDEYWRTSWIFARGASVVSGLGVQIEPNARLERAILWDDVRIAEGCDLQNCIVTDGVAVEPGTTYREAVLWRHEGRLVCSPMRELGVAFGDRHTG